MAEEYNYQVVTGIVKVIRPKGKPVIGVSDGRGMFVWIQEDKIITSHPKTYTNWQTTVFAIQNDWEIQWKEENKWDDYKAQYPKKTIPIPQPVPLMFQQTMPQQQPIYNTTATQPVNYPPQSTTIANNPDFLPQQPQYTQQIPVFSPNYSTINPPIIQNTPPPIIQPPQPSTTVNLTSSPAVFVEIGNELKLIRQLLELYIKPAKLITADKVQVGGLDYIDEDEQYYEEPTDEDHINKDDLPNLF